MIFCEITDGVVTNRAVFDGEMPSDWPNRTAWIASEVAQIGWEHDGTGFIAPPLPEPEPAPPVTSVSARQFKLQLLAAGLIDDVEAWVQAQDRAIQIAYANSGTFVRGEPMMQQGFTDLGFTSAQIDAFFTAAALL